jgi:hypothetical protein
MDFYECSECGNGIIERRPEKWNGIEWVEMLYCAKCGSEWEGETVAMNPAYDTPAARAGSLAGDYKRDCAVAIEDLNRAVYALEKLAADSEIARNALALVALQLDIVRDKAALAALAVNRASEVKP